MGLSIGKGMLDKNKSLSTAGIRTVGHRIYYTDYAIAVPVTMNNNVSFLLNSAKSPNCIKLLVILTLRQIRESLEDSWFSRSPYLSLTFSCEEEPNRFHVNTNRVLAQPPHPHPPLIIVITIIAICKS